VPNPARALHLLHPERHDRADEAEKVLHETAFGLELAEIILSVVPHGLATRFHQDLAHRLAHVGLPVTVVPHEDDAST
jgi:hypothetical protein